MVIGHRKVTYGGVANSEIAPVGLVTFAGADGAKVPFDLGASLSAHLVAAGTTNPTTVKAAPGLLLAVRAFNKAGYPVYIKFHNTAAAPTAGTAVFFTVGVQATLSRDVEIPLGKYFSAGIAFTIVKGIDDADATVVAASDCVVDIDYV